MLRDSIRSSARTIMAYETYTIGARFAMPLIRYKINETTTIAMLR